MTAPTRVRDLLLPTLLTLASRGPASAKNFLSLLLPGPEPIPPPLSSQRLLGTRVTADATRPHIPALLPLPSQAGTRVTADANPPATGTRVTVQSTPTNPVTP